MLTVEALSNSEHETVLGALRPRLDPNTVRSVRAAISFLMYSGTREVKSDLKRLTDSGATVTIIFGDDFHLTQSAALQTLMDIGCELRLYSGEARAGYHPKLWIVDRTDRSRTVLVGSSNLSYGGLVANAEAGVLLHGPSVELDTFDEMWTSFEVDSHLFTADDLKSYQDSERTASVPPPRKPKRIRAATPDAPSVRRHVERWQRYIADPRRIGSSERWRGWYLVPEQGQLSDDKLVELSLVLKVLERRSQYRREGWIDLGTGVAGVANAVAALDGAGVTTQHSFTDLHRRNLFVRQQRLYLQTLGWLEQLDRDRFRITAAGLRFQSSGTARARSRLFTEALELKKWPFGPLAFYLFLLEVLERVPNRRLFYDEMNLIVIHSYHRAELAGIVNLVAEYRALDEMQRLAVQRWADQRLRDLLHAHAGNTAYGRYRRKIADLMVAFGSTTRVEYRAAADEDRSLVRLK